MILGGQKAFAQIARRATLVKGKKCCFRRKEVGGKPVSRLIFLLVNRPVVPR